jgi:2-keto-3-deoxy-6-phosphogluconate aldolase
VGGSWITPREAIIAKDWDTLTALAKNAANLGTA